jgi:alpha-1,6-mannosyltransferase
MKQNQPDSPGHTATKLFRLPRVVAYGLLMLPGYALLFLLLESSAFRESPTLVPDRWPEVFYPIRALLPQGWLTANKHSWIGLLNAGIYLGLLAFLFVVYLRAVRYVYSLRSHATTQAVSKMLKAAFAVTAAILALLFFAPGMLSSDIFSYVWYGRILGVYGDNPFISYPAQYAWSDQAGWLKWVHWQFTPAVYGPLWLWLAGGIAVVAQAIDGDIVTHLLGHKLVASLAHLLNVWLMWKVAGPVVSRFWTEPPNVAEADRAGWQSATRLAITLTYAWNPLLLTEFGVAGHNDVLIVTGMLVAIWMHLAGRWRMAVLALTLAALVKVTTLLLLPGYLWLLFWEARGQTPRKRILAGVLRVAQGAGIMVGAFYLAYWPFVQDAAGALQMMTSGPPTQLFIHSLGAIIKSKVAEGVSNMAAALGWEPSKFWSLEQVRLRLDWPARWGMLMITGAVAIYQTWRARTFPGAISAWGWLLFVYLTVGSVWFWPWYVAWLLVPVALLGPGRLWNATQILCASSMVLYAIFPIIAPPFDQVSGWSGLVVMVPPLLYVLGSYARDVLHRKTGSHAHATQATQQSQQARTGVTS